MCGGGRLLGMCYGGYGPRAVVRVDVAGRGRVWGRCWGGGMGIGEIRSWL